MLIVLESPFFVVELRRRIASSHQAGTSTKPVRIYLLVIVRDCMSALVAVSFFFPLLKSHITTSLSNNLLFLITSTAKCCSWLLKELNLNWRFLRQSTLSLLIKCSNCRRRLAFLVIMELKIPYCYFSSHKRFRSFDFFINRSSSPF